MGKDSLSIWGPVSTHRLPGHYMRSKTATNGEEFQSYVDRGSYLRVSNGTGRSNFSIAIRILPVRRLQLDFRTSY